MRGCSSFADVEAAARRKAEMHFLIGPLLAGGPVGMAL